MPEKIQEKQVFSLLEVTRSIERTIAKRYARTYWIKAEMNKLNHYTHSGHAYPDLVEKKDGRIVAEIRATIWKGTYQRINAEFIKYLGEPLKDGVSLVFEASITYHPLYGMGLNISDIDVSYVLGELEKEKKESIARLVKENLFDKNRNLAFPLLPKRLAIISVETSKGLSDFYKIIQNNVRGYKLETHLYPALLQGDRSIASIINQLLVIEEKIEKYDAVCIIRGGGGEVGLASYNNYELAKAIAVFPIPVLTGIGHATNETVSEMVAYKNAITPSNLAEFLLQHFNNFDLAIENAKQQIANRVEKQFVVEKQKLSHTLHRINWNTHNLLTKADQKLLDSKMQLGLGSSRIFETENRNLEAFKTQLSTASIRKLEDQHKVLESNKKTIKLADPVTILNRGFALLWQNGEIITNSSQLNKGDTIINQLRDGEVETEVLKINTHEKRE